mgnify:CR=1 FL=1
MPKYGVTLYYQASVYVEVEAADRPTALDKAWELSDEMSGLELVDSLVELRENTDIEELKEVQGA